MPFGDIGFTGYWDANANQIINAPPGGASTLIDKPSTQPVLYYVLVGGSTSLGGINDWRVGDWAINFGWGWRRFVGNVSGQALLAALGAAAAAQQLPLTPGGATPRFWLNGPGDGTGVLEFS